MIVSSPQWPDPDTIQSVRSRASELSRQFSYGSTASHISTPGRTPLLEEPHDTTHKRQQSNPFSVLYDSNSPQRHRPSPTKSPAYIDIENGINNGRSPVDAFTSSHNRHPTVTLIDDSELRRGNSVISRLASMRHRNGIRKRTKMVRREDLPEGLIVDELTTSGGEPKGRKKKQPKLSFLFPIRRRRSFNYYPIKAAPKFTSEDEFEKFLDTHGGEVMKEILPQSMAAYQFTNIMSLIPTINIYPQLMHMPPQQPIFRDSEQQKSEVLPSEKSPLPQGRSLAPPRIQRPQQLTYSDNVQYKERVFRDYRQAAFETKGSIPPKLHVLFPLEAQSFTSKEKEQLETRLLFELLLRRTIAAKIDFRLKQQGFHKKERKPKEKPSQNFLSSSSSGPSDRPDKHIGKRSRREPRTPRNTKPAKESDNQNASLLSDPLPSPQISFNANMFDPVYNNSPVSIEDWKQRYISSLDKSPGRGSGNSHLVTNGNGHRKTPSQTYVYNFDNVDLVSKRERSTPNLSNVALYSMQPVTRSEATFTSSEENSAEPMLPNVYTHRSSDSTAETKSNSRGSASTDQCPNQEKRTSESTTNTSVLQSLEDLSESVFHYLRSEGAMVHHRYSLDVSLGVNPDSLHNSPDPSKASSNLFFPKSPRQNGRSQPLNVPTTPTAIRENK